MHHGYAINKIANSLFIWRMIVKEPSIDQYLVATCLSIIDEFNILYRGYNHNQLKKEADEKFNEMDITVRVGYPFKQTVHYTVGESAKTKKVQKINHDLYVEQRNFKIEIKYLKNWISTSDTRSVSKNWSVFQQDFDWLMDEIDSGNKGKAAFVIGWFNCVESFSQLIQLGQGNGAYPLVNESRLSYFPFLKKVKEPTRTKDLDYNYDFYAYESTRLNQVGTRSNEYNCMFIGSRTDCFHFAIYY